MITKLFEDLRLQSFVALVFFSVLGIVGLSLLPMAATFSIKFFGFTYHSTGRYMIFLSGGVLVLLALWANYLLAQHFEILRRNLFAGWYLLWLFIGTWGFTGATAGLASLLLLLIAFYQNFELSKAGKNYYALFNMGWVIAILSMFHAEYIWLFLPFVLAIFSFGNVSWRSIGIPIMGVAMWLFILFTYFYLAEKPGIFIAHYSSIRVFGAFFTAAFSPLFYGWVGLLGLMFLLQLADFFQLSNRANIYKRQAFSSMLLFFLATLALALLVSNQTQKFFPILLLPMALLFANMRQYAKNKWYRLFVMWALPLYILIGFLLQINNSK